MKTINYYMLEANNACPEHLTLFRKTFGVGEIELSKENLKIALDAKLDVSFLIVFLSVKDLVEYDRVCDEAWAEYDRVSVKAWAEYRRVSVKAYAEYDRVCDKAWAEYKWVCNEALIELLNRD